MTKERQNFRVTQGNDLLIRVPITDKDNPVPDSPKDLAGATVTWVLFQGDFPTIMTKTTGDGITIVDINDTDDGIEVVVPAAETAVLEGVYDHEAVGIDSASKTHTFFTGKITVLKARAS